MLQVLKVVVAVVLRGLALGGGGGAERVRRSNESRRVRR
jgi:hypothetical protein